MIVREVKLKLNTGQQTILEGWLWHLTGVWNWAIRKIELDARDGIYYSKLEFQNLLAGHSKTLGIPARVIQPFLVQAWTAWQRCFKRVGRKPRLKGHRNKLNSIPFSYDISLKPGNRVQVPGLGQLRYHKQDIPDAAIKCGRICKRASGWYLCLWLDTEHSFAVQETDSAVGIDPGFTSLLTLSDGTKYENPRELRKGAERYGRAQRGRRKRLSARLLERQANKRKDRNHKIARRIVEDHQTVYYADDHFRGMAGKFGKSVSEAGLGQLLGYITYKGRIAGREIIPVDSRFTTMTCSACGAITGPKGWDGLAVRRWTCSACGAVHDRDVNAACVVLNAGARSALKPSGDRGNGQEPMRARETDSHYRYRGTHARGRDRVSKDGLAGGHGGPQQFERR